MFLIPYKLHIFNIKNKTNFSGLNNNMANQIQFEY